MSLRCLWRRGGLGSMAVHNPWEAQPCARLCSVCVIPREQGHDVIGGGTAGHWHRI